MKKPMRNRLNADNMDFILDIVNHFAIRKDDATFPGGNIA